MLHCANSPSSGCCWSVFLFFSFLCWQLWRAPSAADSAAWLASHESYLSALQERKQQGSRQAIRDSEGRLISLDLAIARAQANVEGIRSGGMHRLEDQESTLALVVIGAGALSLLITLVGIALITRMGREALQSRQALLQQFNRGRRLLPVLMVGMAITLLVSIASALLFEAMRMGLSPGKLSRGEMKLVLASLLCGLLVLWIGARMVWDVLRTALRALGDGEPIEIMGQAASREQAPALWQFVEGVAQRAGAQLPDTIVVGLNESFFVTEHAVVLTNGTPVPAGRTLYLPLPYMAFMQREQVASVVGHELGHFLGEDTEYSLRFTPIYASAVRHLGATSGEEGSWRELLTRPATLFGEFFLESFDRAVNHWSRLRELAADAVGAQVAGAQASAQALLRVSALAPVVGEALYEHWRQGGAQGGVLAMVRAQARSQGLADPTQHMEERQAHPLDTTGSAYVSACFIAPTAQVLAAVGRSPHSSRSYR